MQSIAKRFKKSLILVYRFARISDFRKLLKNLPIRSDPYA